MTQILPIAAMYYNVKQYGAKGDGSTDDTSAISAAITAANSAGGGTIFYPPGTYVTSTQLLYSSIHHKGAGVGATILMLKAGTNSDLFQGSVNGYTGVLVSISAANGTGSNGGVSEWSVTNMTLDGNGGNQTGGPSCCIRVYGRDFTIEDVTMRNGYTNNLYVDWNGTTGADSEMMEARMVNVRCHNSYNGSLIKWAGPHDAQWANVLAYRSTAGTGGNGFHIGPNAAGVIGVNCHPYSIQTGITAVGWLIEAGGCGFYDCLAEGSDTMQVVILANKVQFYGNIFGTGTTNGLQLGQQASLTPFFESVNQSAGSTTAVSVTDCLIKGVFSSLTGTNGSIFFANSGGNNDVEAVCVQASGSTVTGTVNNTDDIKIRQRGLTPDGSLAKSGASIFGVTANNAFSIKQATGGAVLNVNSNALRLELSNNTIIRQYSDGFTTRTVEISNGTISTLASTSAAAIATSGTAATNGVGICRLSPTAAVTGCILQAGTLAGQQVWVVNEATAANTISWATQATSHIAGESGGTFVLAGGKAQMFVYDTSTSLWYKAS